MSRRKWEGGEGEFNCRKGRGRERRRSSGVWTVIAPWLRHKVCNTTKRRDASLLLLLETPPESVKRQRIGGENEEERGQSKTKSESRSSCLNPNESTLHTHTHSPRIIIIMANYI